MTVRVRDAVLRVRVRAKDPVAVQGVVKVELTQPERSGTR